MDNVVPTLPLLRLPNNAILNTIRIMNHLEIFGISLLSKKTKNHVKSMKITTGCLQVLVSDSLEIRLLLSFNTQLHLKLYQILGNGSIQELETPENVYITSENTSVIWTNVMSVKQMLDHFQFIFHSSISILHFGTNCERFSLELIHRNARNFQSIFFVSENHEHNKKTLSVFQPAEVNLAHGSLEDGRIPRYISIQNFDVIRVLMAQITLDDLLLINAQSIILKCDRLSIEFFNRFFKLWTKGANFRLEFLFIRFHPADFQAEELLKGLKYRYAPQNRTVLVKLTTDKKPLQSIGEWDIRRFDGTMATIHVRSNTITFIVLYDHCVVN